MVDVVLTVQRLAPTGITPTRTAISASNVYLVRNSGRMLLAFEKGGAGAATITIQTPVTTGGLAVAEQSVTVPADTGDKMAGPFPPSIYNDDNGHPRLSPRAHPSPGPSRVPHCPGRQVLCPTFPWRSGGGQVLLRPR